VVEMVVPHASLVVLPNTWFQRRGVFDSRLYHHVLLCVFLDSGTDIENVAGYYDRKFIENSASYFLNQSLKWWFHMLF
jgi:Cu2+-containing amine oxidase